MCGITGIWNLDGAPLLKESLERFNNAQRHRGPDGEGYFYSADGTLGFGHRRLSILDISENGRQPMTWHGRYTISFNGEIFNFIEIREELRKKGVAFRTESDTEVILAAYSEWGAGCLDKFNGMWAFAIWDEQEQSLFLARDRFGIKPLHYLFLPGKQLAFSSETVPFRHLDGFRREPDPALLNAVIRDTFALEGFGKTIFKNIEQLPGGHYLRLRKNSAPETTRWWNTTAHLHAVPETYAAQAEAFRGLLFDSCRLRLRSDVPIASALSGGLDSSSIYASVKHLAANAGKGERFPSEWQTAFVATFPGAENDERQYAEKVVEHVHGKAVYIEPDAQSLVSEIISSTRQFDAIYLSPVSVAAEIYGAMRQHGIRVSLDGHGVDEMLLGYPFMLATAYRELVKKGNLQFAQQVEETYYGLFPADRKVASLSAAATAPAKPSRPSGNRFSSLVKTILGREKPAAPAKPGGEWFPESRFTADEATFYPGMEKIPAEERAMFRDFHLTTLPTILRNFDRASMQKSIEVRMPFMDWRLVTFVFSLPLSSKVGEGFNKRILRDAMTGILPEDIRLRKRKIGLNAPMPMWFSGALKEFIRDEVHGQRFRQSDLWNGAAIEQFVNSRSANGWSWDDCNRFWPVLNAHLILNNSAE